MGKNETFSLLFEVCPTTLWQVVEHLSDDAVIYCLHHANSHKPKSWAGYSNRTSEPKCL